MIVTGPGILIGFIVWSSARRPKQRSRQHPYAPGDKPK